MIGWLSEDRRHACTPETTKFLKNFYKCNNVRQIDILLVKINFKIFNIRHFAINFVPCYNHHAASGQTILTYPIPKSRYSMTKSLLTLAVAIGLSSVWTTASSQSAVEHGNRVFYGFFLSNHHYTNANYGEYGFAKQTFASPGENELLYPFDGSTGIYAATCAEGIYYACPYQYSTSMEEPSAMPVMTYNLSNGLVEELGVWAIQGSHFKPSDMTYDISSKKIYAIAFNDNSETGVYEMNPATGELTFICKAQGGVIAADAVGRVFTIDHDGWLYQVNLENGRCTPIFKTGCQQMMSNQTMEFDHTTGKLYWASCTYEEIGEDGSNWGDLGRATHLREITLPAIGPNENYTSSMTGYSIENMGEIGSEARFQGLYIPYAEGGFDAPAAVEDFTAKSNEDGTAANLSFILPTKTFGGDDLGNNINGYVIYRDGEQVHYSSSVKAGDKVEWTDQNIKDAGQYRYDVIVYNTNGDGPKTPAFSYIGLDRPAAVSDIKTNIADDFASVTLSWTAPANGAHLGTFDPATVTYDVVRLPDNYTVATDLKETSVTDNFFRRMLCYSYQIIAKNEQGQTKAVSKEFIAGPVKEVPVTEDFIDENSFRNAWMTYDNNNDGLNWLFGTTLGHSVFGDYEQTAEYIVSPTSIDENTKDADEWLISPPIKFEAGKKYSVVFRARSIDLEKVNLYFGTKNDVESMKTKIGSYDVVPLGIDPSTQTVAFGTFEADIPAEAAGTIGCVGLQLVTPLGAESPSHYFQVTTITIDEKDESAITDITTDTEAAVYVSGNDIIAPEGSTVYDLAGRRVSSTGLPSGIYIVNTPSRAVKVAVK